MDISLIIREVALLSALGGVLALDDRAGWQGLISQPIFAALIAGFLIGNAEQALVVGLAMELVWLAILPMRGTKRPDAVAGAVAGAGTACILFDQTGDPRVGFILASSALAGLIVGEVAGLLVRRLGRFRGERIGRFSAEGTATTASIARKLDRYQTGALAYVFILEAAMLAVALPVSLWSVTTFTELVGEPFATGTRWWLDLLPALGAAAMIQHFWHRPSNRFLAIAAVIVMVILWIR